ncbi:MAG: hypothetical protein P8172_14805 [Gammaproteobacteria bacterium]
MFAKFHRTPSRLSLVSAAAALLALGAIDAAAQMPEGHPGMGSGGGELMQKIQSKRMEIERINQQLMDIQRQAIEANPQLAKQRDELISFVDTKMGEAGYDTDAGRDRIEKLQSEMQSGELSAEDEQANRQALRQEMGAMQQAQGQVMQDEEFQSKREALNENLVEAMQEQSPQTESLIAQLEQAQQEYRQLAQQAMQQQGMAPPPGGGSR